ncbi:MAG: hypothetical protein LIP01_06585 [Tannerellaceae bacterium]|nr:hypothetical protein [Tannerellaceae bacterium]
MVEIIKEAGKKYLIREEMYALDTSVVGDKIEGVSDPFGRLAIHANKLCLIHPETGEEMCFQSYYPPVFNSIVKNNPGK